MLQRDTEESRQQSLHNAWAHGSTLVHFIQRERGYSASYLATGRHDPLLLKQMREDSNAALKSLTNNVLATEQRMSRSGLADVAVRFMEVRNQVDKQTSNWRVVRDAYTGIVNTLLTSVQFELTQERSKESIQLDAIAELALAREALGLLRATVNSIRLNSRDVDINDLIFMASELTIYRQHLSNFKKMADDPAGKKLQAMVDSDIYIWVFATINQVLSKKQVSDQLEEWWPRSSSVMDMEKAIEDASFTVLQHQTETDIAVHVRNQNTITFFAITLCLGLAYYVSITIGRMMRDIRRLAVALDDVVDNENYTIRLAQKGSQDEFGHIFLLFNKLLEFTDGLLREKEKLASVDTLTGVMNRRSFLKYADREISRAKRHTQELALVFMDIDHFKRVNDTYGHHVGDEVLKAFANIIRERVRSTDLMARWGGEEFIILLPETGKEAAHALADSLRGAVASAPFPAVGQVSCSAGVAGWQHGESFELWCARADAALYKAKEGGRNRVISAS